MKNNTKKRLIDCGILAPPGQTRKDAFSLSSIGYYILFPGLLTLLFLSSSADSSALWVGTAFTAIGVILTVIGDRKQTKERGKNDSNQSLEQNRQSSSSAINIGATFFGFGIAGLAWNIIMQRQPWWVSTIVFLGGTTLLIAAAIHGKKHRE